MECKTLVPELRFPDYIDNWLSLPLNEVSNIYDGTHQTPNYTDEGIPFYSVEHVTANQFVNTKYISREVFLKENKRVKLERNDILMTRIGDIGTPKYIDWDVDASFYVSLALIKQSSKIISNFLCHYINSVDFQREIHKRVIHVAFPKKINLGEIGKCIICKPSKGEQQKIASFLTSVDNRISLLEKKKQALEQYKKGVMQKLFSQEIRFKDEHGNNYPAWEEKKLGEVAITNPKSNSLPKSFIYIDLESVNKGRLTKKKIISKHNAPSRAQRLLKKNDILYQTVRPYQKNNYFFNLDGEYVASTGYAQIRTDNISKYLYQYLHTEIFVGKVMARCIGTSYPAINSNDLSSIIVQLPSLPEQQKIANILSSLDNKIGLTNTNIEKSKEFKKGLLQKMFV